MDGALNRRHIELHSFSLFSTEAISKSKVETLTLIVWCHCGWYAKCSIAQTAWQIDSLAELLRWKIVANGRRKNWVDPVCEQMRLSQSSNAQRSIVRRKPLLLFGGWKQLIVQIFILSFLFSAVNYDIIIDA